MTHSEIVVKCCRCQRVKVGDEWVREHDARRAHARYSHSFCPVCLVKVHAEVEVADLAPVTRPAMLVEVIG